MSGVDAPGSGPADARVGGTGAGSPPRPEAAADGDPSTRPSTGVRRRPLLVVGAPRSGTTWVRQVLGQDPGVLSLAEPDSEGNRGAAIRAKRAVGRFPCLSPGDRADEYRRLWVWILAGAPVTPRQRVADWILAHANPDRRARYYSGRRSPLLSLAGTVADIPDPGSAPAADPRTVVVKSVHAPLTAEWLDDEFDIDVLVLHRHPGAILASWLALRSTEYLVRFAEIPAVQRLAASWDVPPPGPDALERTIWQIGVLATALSEAEARRRGGAHAPTNSCASILSPSSTGSTRSWA